MDRVFSVDEMADQFWSPHAPPLELDPASSCAAAASSPKMLGMSRSPSEWAFQRFLQEAASPDRSSTNDHYRHNENPHRELGGPPPLNIPINSEEYHAYLKSRLDLACAAVALTRATKGKTVAVAASDIFSQGSNSSQNKGWDLSKTSDKDLGRSVGLPLIPASTRKSGAQVKSTSGSYEEQSDDDEAEGENETTQNMDASDAKRAKRMISNRESARRSRRRKQERLTELEAQVSELRVENSSLLKRLTEISQKYNEAAVDNRVLKAYVETLRAKVKMAEETMKRVTGFGLKPYFATDPSDMSADFDVPIQHVNDPRKQQYYHSTDDRIQNSLVVRGKASGEIGASKVGRRESLGTSAETNVIEDHLCLEEGSEIDMFL